MTCQVMIQLYYRVIYSLYENISSTNCWWKVWSLACILIMQFSVFFKNTRVSFWLSFCYTCTWHGDY